MKQFNLDEYLKNPSRKVITRDGRAVKIYCTDYIGDGPVIAKIEGTTFSNSFWKDGSYVSYRETNNDLFFAPEKHEGWIIINKWPDGERDTNGIIYNNKSDIPDMPPVGAQRIATIKIEWEE